MAKRHSIRGIKQNQTYTVEELADVTKASQPAVRSWIKDGLPVIDTSRPTLILGFHALDYLGKRQEKAKRPMALNQLYCMRCKARRKPYGLMADYSLNSVSGSRLAALCGECGCTCYRNISADQLPDFLKVLDVVIRDAE